MKDRVN